MEDKDSLLSFVSDIAGDRYLKVEEDLGGGYVRLKLGEADRRQAKHDIRSIEDIAVEVLRNSRDAGSTRIFFATAKERSENRRITIIDDGEGVPNALRELVFEPRVTSRLNRMVEDTYGVHGRGMALFAIRRIAQLARFASAEPDRGCSLEIQVELSKLPERKDQSTLPELRRKQGAIFLVGPHNLPRTALEFAIANPAIELFYGSPAEVLSTMYWLSNPQVGNRSYAEVFRDPDFKLWSAVGAARDASELAALAGERFGLVVSARNANRILRGEIEPLPSIIELAGGADFKARSGNSRLAGALPAADRISRVDLDAFAKSIDHSLGDLKRKYFLEASVLQIRKDKDTLKIVIQLDDAEKEKL